MIAENQPQSFERPELGQETLTSKLTKIGANIAALRNRESGSLTQEMPV